MEAKQNSLFFNASDIFNLKPQLSRNTYKYVPTPKSTDNPHSSPITQDMTSDNNRNTISPSLHKQRRDITPKINAKRKLRLCNAKDKHCVLLSTIKDDEIVVDTAKEARAQRKRNIDKVHNDAVLLGTDSNNYVTTNEAYQQHAKRQLKKSKTLCILNKNANKNAITTPSTKGKKYLRFTSRNTNGIANAKPGNTDYENKFYNNLSNIFNDPCKDKLNKALTPTKPSCHNKTERPSTKLQRKNYTQNPEAALPVMNWQDHNIELLRKRIPQQENANTSTTNVKAKRVKTALTHNKSVDDVNVNRSNVKAKKDQHKHATRTQEQYQLIADNHVDINKIKRIYRNNGLHVFGEKVHYNMCNADSKLYYLFNIRINNDNNDYESRMEKTLTDIHKTTKGIIIRKLSIPKYNADTSITSTEAKDIKARRKECRKWLEGDLRIRKEEKEGILKSYKGQPVQAQHKPK